MENLLKQILKFGTVGFIAFIIDYIVLYILTDFYNIYYLLSSVISFIISVIFNYILSVKWVFTANKNQTLKDFIIFIILSTFGLIINAVIMYLIVDMLHIHYMLSKLFATVIVMIYNFITRKIFVEKY